MSAVRTVVLAEGALDVHSAKTAVCLLRFRPDDVVAVIDSTRAGRTCDDVLGVGGATPVVASLDAALPLQPTRLLVGTHPAGGGLDDATRATILDAIEHGLEVASGLHHELGSDPQIAVAASRHRVALHDLRAVPSDLTVPDGSRDATDATVILTVGTDCNVGKMTAAWRLVEQLRAAGRSPRFVPTGQTGVLLAGSGFAIDRVISDFVPGATERLLREHAPDADVLLLEGQGSLLHPFYSGVTLGLMHGAQPEALILCHVAGRTHLRHSAQRPVPKLAEVIDAYQTAAAWVRPAPVIGVALATHGLDEAAARRQVEIVEGESGRPTEDVVRFPTGRLATAIQELMRTGA